MKIFGCPQLIRLLFCFAIILFVRVSRTSGKVDSKTKLLLQNIRSHLAQKAEEIIQQKECESDLTLCKTKPNESAEGSEDSDEIKNFRTKSATRSSHKPQSKVTLKEIHQVKPYQGKNKDIRSTQKKKHTKEGSPLKQINLARHFSNQESFKLDQSLINKKSKNKNEQELPKRSLKKSSTEPPPKRVDEWEMKNPKITTKPKLTNEKLSNENYKAKKSKKIQNDRTNPKKVEIEDKILKKPLTIPELYRQTTTEKSGSRFEEIKFTFPAETFLFLMESNDYPNGHEMCQKHRSIYLKQLKKHKMWALMMFDASAKLPSGILQGNINQYGDFDECLSINAVFKKSPANEPSGIRGKYCLANLDLAIKSTKNEAFVLALERANSFSFIKSTVNDPNHFIPRFTSINWGLCVPDTCPAEDVERFIVHQLRRLNSTSDILFGVDVAEDNCVVKKDLNMELTGAKLIVILFYAMVVATACYATYADAIKPKASKLEVTDSERLEKKLEEAAELKSTEKVSIEMSAPVTIPKTLLGKLDDTIMAFSFKKNFAKLFEDEKDESIGCINGVKALFSIMLFLAHKTIPLGWTAFSNRLMLTKMSNEGITAILRASIIYTDSFLLMSGLLTAYNLSKEIASKGRIQWRRRMTARYIRLTPALLAVLLFYAFIWDHTGSGPLWNTLVKKNSKLCRTYLWRNLLYIQNMFPFEYMCAPQTHQLALDMQLSLLAPLLVYFLFRYGKVGFGILQALFLLSSIVRYLSTSKNDLSVIVYHGMPVSQLYRTANLLYTQTLHRASPYLMGTIVGYYLQKYKGRIGMPKALVAVGWILAFACAFYSVVSSSNMTARGYAYDKTEAAQYASLSPVSWSLSLAWVISACHWGYGGKLNAFLCNKTLLVFSRISYSFNLTQFLVFFYKVGVKRVPELFTLTGSFDICEFFTVVIVSTAVTVLFDIPMTEIKKIILDRSEMIPPRNATSEEEETEPVESQHVPNAEAEPHKDEPEEVESEDEEENPNALELRDDVLDDVTDDSFTGEVNDNVDDAEDEDADVEEETDEVDELDDRFEKKYPVRRFFDDEEDPDWLKDDS